MPISMKPKKPIVKRLAFPKQQLNSIETSIISHKIASTKIIKKTII